MTGKANLEVRPTFINKGEIVKRLVADYNKDISHVSGPSNGETGKETDGSVPVEFALCMGDDFTDEDMFRALNGLSGVALDAEAIFTVTVGASTKVTLAKWHVLEPADVVEATSLLAGVGNGDDNALLSQVNFAAVAELEGKVPQ